MSAAFDLATKLQSLLFGTIGNTIGVNNFLNDTDAQIAVYEFAGEDDDITHGSVAFEYPAIQVQVRRVANEAARSKCREIYVALRNQKDLTINGRLYQWIEPKKSPQKLQVDEAGRTTWYCEFLVHRTAVDA